MGTWITIFCSNHILMLFSKFPFLKRNQEHVPTIGPIYRRGRWKPTRTLGGGRKHIRTAPAQCRNENKRTLIIQRWRLTLLNYGVIFEFFYKTSLHAFFAFAPSHSHRFNLVSHSQPFVAGLARRIPIATLCTRRCSCQKPVATFRLKAYFRSQSDRICCCRLDWTDCKPSVNKWQSVLADPVRSGTGVLRRELGQDHCINNSISPGFHSYICFFRRSSVEACAD